MRQADFVHLHLHSAYSLLQSSIRLPQLLKRARDYRLPALAVTDHSNLFGCIEFYDLAYSHGIKPIIGCEVAVGNDEESETEHESGPTPEDHLVLLARNQKGYQNLLQLVTLAHARGWQPAARNTQSQLQDHHRGLIALSGCLQGGIAKGLLQGDLNRAVEKGAKYRDIFGREQFFIEMQPPLTDAHRRLNEELQDLAQQLDLQIVATANCHTLDPGEAELIRVLTAIRLGLSIDETAEPAVHSFLTPEEMKAEFAHQPEAIANTIAIAERCNVELELGRIHLPRFPLDKGQEAQNILTEHAEKGLEERLSSSPDEGNPEYTLRLERELQVIDRLGLADYFLVVADFVSFAKRRGVPVGPGSGSAGASVTAFGLGITEIDPLHHGLVFERLVNPLSPELPDMDLGFGMEMREQVRGYLREKYGHDRVAHIASLGTFHLRTAIRDLGKVLDLSQHDLEATATQAEAFEGRESEGGTASRPTEVEPSPSGPRKAMELATALEGLPRQVSTHPTGVVIGDSSLTQRAPLFLGSKDEWVSQYDMRAIKRVGLVKFDLIARKTLTVIRKALASANGGSELLLALEKVDVEDASAYDLLCRGEIAGIPRLEGGRASDLLHKWQPRTWNDLLVLMALISPAPLESGMTEKVLQARLQQQQVDPDATSSERELTDGVELILFDVDLIRLITKSTGWSEEKADNLYRLLSKLEGDQAEDLRQEFIEEAVAKGSAQTEAEKIWADVERSAGLAVDKSKTVAQALTVLQAAYTKARFPEHYMAALLSSELHQPEFLANHIGVCRQEGLKTIPPDINTSEVEFSVEPEGIRIGLAAIRQVTHAVATAIFEARRDKGQFGSLLELCSTVGLEHLGKKALAALIKAGALDGLHRDRQQLLDVLPEVMEQARLGQMALFESHTGPTPFAESPAAPSGWDEPTKLAHEREALGFYLSGHPLDEYRSFLEQISPGGTESVRHLPADAVVRLGGTVEHTKVVSSRKTEPLRFVRLEDFGGSLEVVIFADVYAEHESYLEKGSPVFVSGRVVREGIQVRLIAGQIMPLEEAEVSMATSLRLHLPVEGLSGQELNDLHHQIAEYTGPCEVYLHFHIGQQAEVVQKLPTTFAVKPTRDLVLQLTGRFGKGSVEVRYGEGEGM
jgi:DNA polymerase-3 subunit alpha